MKDKLFTDFSPMDASTWRDLITKELKGASFDSLSWQTAGIEGKAFYTKEDLPAQLPPLQFANKNPEKEGVRHWVNYQVIDVSDDKIANEKAIHALNSGANGLLFNIKDMPNFDLLLKDVLLPYCHVSFHIQGSGKALLAKYESFVVDSGHQAQDIHGFIQSSESPFSKVLNNFRTGISISKNANSCIELACLLAKAIDILDQPEINKEGLKRHFDQLQFSLQVGESYFVEIAKHRALRILVGQLASTYGFNNDLNSIEITSFSGEWDEPTKDEYNYLLRASTQAMASIIGGTDAIVIQPFYQLFSKNPAQAERMARNISIILKEESYFDKTIDPAAGAYFIEAITNQIVEHTWSLLQAIEAKGGLSKMSETEIEALTQNETA